MTGAPMDERRWALDGAQARRVHDALWTRGDYTVAEKLTALSTAVVQAAEIRDGQDVLDLGAGAGNTAIDAARAGGRVVSGDLSGDLFDTCRRRAEQAGVRVDWIQLNPEQLPLPPGSVDRVLSAAGGPLAFAPDPVRVAQELARVLRPGGLVVLASWTRQGLAGHVSAAMARYLPAPPPGGADPWTWAEEASARALLAPLGLQVGIEATRQLAGPDVDDPLAIIVITTFDLDEYVHGALKAGARGFLLKDAGPELLIQAIHAAANGDALIAPSVTARLLAAFSDARTGRSPVQPIEPLTGERRKS